MNVLITCCLGDYVKTDVDIIKMSYPDVHIVGVDASNMIFNHVGVDEFVKCPLTRDEKYVDFLLNVCKEKSIDVLIPTSALDVDVILPRINSFDCYVTIGKNKGTMIANNKALFGDFSELHRIKYPPTEVFKPGYETEYARFEGPYAIKSVFKKGIRVIDSVKEINDSEKEEKNDLLIVQKYLSGDEFSCICLCKKGEVVFSSVTLNKKMIGGTAGYATIVNRPDIVDICSYACKELELDGMVGFDLKEDDNGDVFILECNPRITATASLTVMAGVNIIKAMIDYFVTDNYELDNEELDYGMSIMRYRADVFFKEDSNG